MMKKIMIVLKDAKTSIRRYLLLSNLLSNKTFVVGRVRTRVIRIINLKEGACKTGNLLRDAE